MRRASSHNYIGERRTICKFLFLPKVIDAESRWLEWACIEQVWGYSIKHFVGIPIVCLGWKDEHWVDHMLKPPKAPSLLALKCIPGNMEAMACDGCTIHPHVRVISVLSKSSCGCPQGLVTKRDGWSSP